VFALACGSVGVRLLLIHRRSRQLPELLLALALLTIIVCAPLLAVSGLGRGVVGAIRFAPLVLGLALFWLYTLFTGAFTWRAFRPAASWGGLLVAALCAAHLAAMLGALRGLAAAPESMPSIDAAWGWFVAVRVPPILALAWTGGEAFRQWRMARRRVALGIGDPVVCNRFALWCAVGSFSTANNLVSTLLQAQGIGPVAHPVGAAVIALSGLGSSALLWLVFMPPARYQAWVIRRASA
jgi:hypothetical protein